MAYFSATGTGGGSSINLPLLDILNHTYRFETTRVQSNNKRVISVYIDGTLYKTDTIAGGNAGGGVGNIYINSEETDVLKGAYNIRFFLNPYQSSSSWWATLAITINNYTVFTHSNIGAGSSYDTGELTFE